MSESEPPDIRQLQDNMAEASESEKGRRKSEDVKSADVAPSHGTKSGDGNDDPNENVDVRKEDSNDSDKNGARLAEEKQDGGHARLKQQNSSESKKKRKKRKKKKGGAVGGGGGGGEEEKGVARKRGSFPKEEINGNEVKKDVSQPGGDGVSTNPGESGKEKFANKKSENREKSHSHRNDGNETSENGEKSSDNGEHKISESTGKSHVGVEKKNSETVEKLLNGDENENCENAEELQEGVENKNNENSEKSRELCERSREICENSHEVRDMSHGVGEKSREIGETSHDVCEKSHEVGEMSYGVGEKIPTENSANRYALQEVLDNRSSELLENLQANEASVNSQHKDSPNESLSNSEHSLHKDSPNESLSNSEHSLHKDSPNESLFNFEHSLHKDSPNEGLSNSEHSLHKDSPNESLSNSEHSLHKDSPNESLSNSEHSLHKDSPNESLSNHEHSLHKDSPNESLSNSEHSLHKDSPNESLSNHEHSLHKDSPNESLSNSEHSTTQDEAQEKDEDTNRVHSLNEGVTGENARCEEKTDEEPSERDIKDSNREPRGDDLAHSKPTEDNEASTGDTRTEASPGTRGERSEAMPGEARGADQLAQRENDADNLTEGADPPNVDKTGCSDKTCQRDDKRDRVTQKSEDTEKEPAEAGDSGEHGVEEGVIGEGCAEKEVATAEADQSDRKDAMDTQPRVDTSGESSNGVDISDKTDSVVSCESEKDNNISRVGEEGKDKGAKVKTAPSANSHMTEDQLRKQNSDTLEAMTRLQALAVEQKVQANLAMTSLRTKLRRRDNELKLIKSQNEQQMLSVLSRLLFLEGHMQKEHKEIVEILQDKDDVIRRQKAAIADLTQKNERLLQRLRETHGYAGDNGLTKPDNLIVNQAENISIQDHGNKVILRGSKLKNGEKIPSKVRFSAMKERLKRHKSSLELYQSEPLETLVEGGIRYGSQESLVTQNGRPKDFDRKERCRSLMDYPFGLRDVYEHHNESPDSCFGDEFNSPDISHTDSVSSSTSSLVNIGERNGSGGSVVGRPGNRPMMSYGFNELSKSRSVPHALPTVSENDTGSTNFKERPLSLPSVELLAKNLAPSSAGDNTSTKGTKTSLPPPSPTNSSPPSESSAFKSFKNVFKRRGSKKKKSGTGIADGQDSNTETLKQHFKKYNLS
ncbi:unnamed protein product [Lymnaea stagnalis]|uniref:Uncharacterized protein n=1 Tax=Lymnaea stagnalis TaxID=6523 RepID=A0AAV2HGF3_LYMST